MKRKLITIFFIALAFAWIFAISAFGAVNYSEMATLADGTTLPIYDEAHNPLIWYVSGTDQDGNNVYSSVPNNRNEPNENHDTYVTYVSTTGTWAQLTDIYIHTYNETTGEYDSTIDDNLQIVVLNLREFDMIYLGSINVNYIQYMYYPATLKDCPEFFKQKTALRLVDMSVCTNLVGGFGGTQNFRDCINLHTVRLPIGPSYTFEGGNNYKFKSTAISSIIIPEAVTSLGTDNFYSCAKLESIYILGNNTGLGKRNFSGCTSLENLYFLGDSPSITATEFKENFVECVDEGKTYTFDGIGKYFYFVSTDLNYLTEVKEAVGAVSIVSYNDYKANPSNYTEGRYVIYGANICEILYNNEHDLEEVDSCLKERACERTNCDYVLVPEYSEHKMAEALTFVNGITAEGIYYAECQNDGCAVKTEETVKPVFTAKGYSTNTDKNAINGGYEVNLTSLALYERLISTLKYGIVIANASSFGEKTFLDQDNKVNSDKALQVEMEKQYSSFDCSINFGTNTTMDLDLVICAYVIEGDTVTYIQSSTGDDVTIGGESFKSITLAQVVALVPAESKEN
ncbi:MAG: leucine-rich repeat protein [Clostridia bacterium]|nr:leucine-rich repeat protein [Clostridia bacterium]